MEKTNSSISEKDEKITKLEQILKEKEEIVGANFIKLKQKKRKIAKLNLCIKDNQENIDKLKDVINQRDKDILFLEEANSVLQKKDKEAQLEKEREE